MNGPINNNGLPFTVVISHAKQWAEQVVAGTSALLEAVDYQAWCLSRLAPNPQRENEMCLALKMSGEVGEVCDLIGKVYLHGKPVDNELRAKLKLEIGDVLWYVAALAGVLGWSIDDLMKANVEKLTARAKDAAYAAANPNIPTEVKDAGAFMNSVGDALAKAEAAGDVLTRKRGAHAFELDSTTSGLSERFQKCGRCTLPRAMHDPAPESPKPEPWCGACGDTGRVADEMCRACSGVRPESKPDPALQEPLFDPNK